MSEIFILLLAILYAIPSLLLTFGSSSEFINPDTKHCILYAIWCISIASLPLCLHLIFHKLTNNRTGIFIATVLYTIIASISFLAIYLAVLFHSSINYNILALVTGTNLSEATEFFSNYILNANTIYLILIYTFLHVITYTIVKKARRIPLYNLRLYKMTVFSFCIILSISIPFQIKHFQYFSNNSSHNINKLRKDNSMLLYDPLCCIYNAILQIQDGKEDFDIAYKSCDAGKITLYGNSIDNIIIIIGESHNKYHSSLYGYPLHTNPLLESDSLIIFKDVISPRQITSHSLKAFLSFANYGDSPKWCERPLFPAILKKSGYNVVFYSNEFPFYGENSPWNSEAGFLTDGKISKKLFSYQNDYMYKYDGQLLDEYDKHRNDIEGGGKKLIIFQLRGQHFTVKDRFPSNYKKFQKRDYRNRTKLSETERQEIADYDNACLYNDWIIHRIISMYKNQESIILYFSDHGEEANDYRRRTGRDFGKLTSDGAHCLLDIPFFVYISKEVIRKYPEIYSQISNASDKAFTIDHLPHFISYLAGVYSEYYDVHKNILDPQYDTKTPRIVLDSLNYDSLTIYSSTFKINYGY